jgi:hypothetical protein
MIVMIINERYFLGNNWSYGSCRGFRENRKEG